MAGRHWHGSRLVVKIACWHFQRFALLGLISTSLRLGLALLRVCLAGVTPLEVDELALVPSLLRIFVDARRPELHAEHGRRLQVARMPCCWRGAQ